MVGSVAAGGAGSFVDISQIPLAALERVDILTDGASAIYGSDAVGGVVNFVLRDDYDGAETRLRYGTVTDGGADEFQIGQSFGKSWKSGNAVASYEYYKRDRLDASERSNTEDALGPFDILPKQERHSLFGSLSQNINQHVEAFGTVLYTSREASRNAFDIFSIEPRNQEVDTEQLTVSLGSHIKLGETWQADIAGTFSTDSSINDTIRTAVSELRSTNELESRGWIADFKVDGELASVPGGDVKVAIGGQYRKNKLNTNVTVPVSSVNFSSELDEKVAAGFLEMFVPIVGSANQIPGIRRLEVTAAGRYEHNSNFGDSIDPKIGILWSPVGGLDFRGTWGTSFRAPLLTELDESLTLGLFIFTLPDASSMSGVTTTGILIGNNSELEAEESTNWTLGFDFQPDAIPGLSVSATYFDIAFDNRIADPNVASVLPSIFSEPTLASLIDRTPDLTFMEEKAMIAAAQNSFFDLSGGVGIAGVQAIVDGRIQNLARTNVAGLDFAVSYSTETGIGELAFSFDATYFNDFENQITSLSSFEDVLGTVYNPPEFRFRSGVSWSNESFGLSIFVNHVGGLTDDRVDPALSIDSWTTVDLRLTSNIGEWADVPLLEDTSAYVSVTNIFDQEPPVVNDPNQSLNFDAENHDILGRFVAIGITHKW